MTPEARKDAKFYTTLMMGFILIIISIWIPPIGVIPTSVLYASAMFIVLAGALIGLDIPAILHEINELKRLKLSQLSKTAAENKIEENLTSNND